MHAAGHPAQQAFRRTARLHQKGVHIVAAGQIQIRTDLAVQAVFHGHIHGHTALVHNGVQLPAHFVLGAVHAGQDAGITFLCRVQLVAPRRRVDLRPACTQQCHVPHHDLPGDPQLSGQCTGTYRVLGTAQPGQDAFSALCCVHLLSGSPSVFRRCCPYCSKTGRNVQAAYFFNRRMVA